MHRRRPTVRQRQLPRQSTVEPVVRHAVQQCPVHMLGKCFLRGNVILPARQLAHKSANRRSID